MNLYNVQSIWARTPVDSLFVNAYSHDRSRGSQPWLQIYSYIAALANQICQEGVCKCSPGFAKNSDEECIGKILNL